MKKIHFGTDGWRGIIGEDFIFDNIRRVACALAAYLKQEKAVNNPVVIGYDNRFLSEESSKIFAYTLLQNKIPTALSNSAIPTPVLSYATRKIKAPVGVMMTASHNPYYYNGLKFKMTYGGPAMPKFTSTVESLIPARIPKLPLEEPAPPIPEENFLNDYRKHVRRYIDFNLLKKSKIKVLIDSMHGSGANILADLLQDTGVKTKSIRTQRNVFFGGGLPEPILHNLKEASSIVKNEKFDLALATDGDADRIGVLDSNGNFVQLHYLMPLLYQYLQDYRGLRGAAVRTTSTDNLFDELVKTFNEKIIEVPVGFKNVCEQVLTNNILVGGEESGGIHVKNHIPERDGILIGLLILEMIAASGKSINDLVNDLTKRYWKIHYLRTDRYANTKKLKSVMNSLRQSPPSKIGVDYVESVSIIDGIKFYFKNGGWLLFRVSDTEPLGRIYCAARDAKTAKRLLSASVKLIFE